MGKDSTFCEKRKIKSQKYFEFSSFYRIFASNKYQINMKNFRLLLIVFLCGFALTATAQKKFSVYGVGFYNVENLFDTCHDVGKRDFEYLPNGSNRWNARKYKSKLRNMSKALADLGTDVLPNVGCAVIGMAEVENAKALDDLTAEAPLRARGYKYILVEGPDMRGVDVALLYRPNQFKVLESKSIVWPIRQRKRTNLLRFVQCLHVKKRRKRT